MLAARPDYSRQFRFMGCLSSLSLSLSSAKRTKWIAPKLILKSALLKAINEEKKYAKEQY
jgi:hypothetical protein